MSEAVVAGAAVRPAHMDDLAAAESLLQEARLPVDGVADGFADGYVVAETEAGGLVGVAGVEVYGAYGLLRSVAVAGAARGQGVGEALVRDRIGWARGRGLRRLYLLTTTADAWFPRLGFTRVSRDDVPVRVRRSSEFAETCPSSAVVMELRLVAIPEPCCGGARRGADTHRAAAGDADALKASVRERYGAAATRAASGAASSCCGASADELWDPITADLYDDAETRGLPAEAVLASLGCGNPTALAQLHEGETVLDLGSGGGIDVLLSARRVGSTGKAYGLDMTDEMLALARANQARAGADNVEFLKGDIEAIPLPDGSVDVIISNCVINLAADKAQVLREAFRVLKPGGRFAVSDVVARRAVPDQVRTSMELWMGCVAGALQETEYARLLAAAGFTDIAIEPTRIYDAADARHFLVGADLDVPADLEDYDGAFMGAFVRARKP
jgi:arsenite methyltransferase